VNRLEDTYSDDVKFVFLDANQDGKSAFTEAQFRGHPAVLLMLPDGDEAWRFQGVATYEQMEEEILAQTD
jgi:hypothetical protein